MGLMTLLRRGGVESWNGTYAVTVDALLYGAALSAKYWSAALVHAVFLHTVSVHSRTGRMPHEAWYGTKPDLKLLRMFGARVCVKGVANEEQSWANTASVEFSLST